jgi:hypothetical protein
LVIDCTITGALLPTRTPMIEAVTVFLRWIWAMFNHHFKLWLGKEREPHMIRTGFLPTCGGGALLRRTAEVGCPYASSGLCTSDKVEDNFRGDYP